MSGVRIALLPIRRYAELHGRSTRTELVWFLIFTSLAGLVLTVALGMFSRAAFLANTFLELALLCPMAALTVRRLHDSGRSGWWGLIGLVALVSRVADQYRATIRPYPIEDQPWESAASAARRGSAPACRLVPPERVQSGATRRGFPRCPLEAKEVRPCPSPI